VLKSTYHNVFEKHHRFVGWLGLAVSAVLPSVSSIVANIQQMTWAFVIMGNTYDIKRGEWRSDSHSLLSAQELWFAVFMTVL
jgi:hypothetical protein